MDPNYKELRRQEFLNGTQSWDYSLTDNDFARFTKEYVEPLTQLKREGRFASHHETPYAVDGNNYIISVVVT
jgi:hypothetical protein